MTEFESSAPRGAGKLDGALWPRWVLMLNWAVHYSGIITIPLSVILAIWFQQPWLLAFIPTELIIWWQSRDLPRSLRAVPPIKYRLSTRRR